MNFKILIVGLGNEGKTTLVNRLKTGDFTNLPDETTLLTFSTNHGPVSLEIKPSNMYEEGHDAEIVMFDLTRPRSMAILDEIPETKKPRVVVGNKCDLKDEIKVTVEEKYERIVAKGNHYYDISAKTNYNYEKPFLYLLRKLIKEDLIFVENEAMNPPTVGNVLVSANC